MADWSGSARTNYFPVDDIDGLKASIEPFSSDLKLEENPTAKGRFYLSCTGQTGGFPSTILNPDDEEISFDFAEHVMPFVSEEFVVICMESGAEELRYITAFAEAFIRKGSAIKQTIISLDDIYEKAAATFGIPDKQIVRCMYDYVEGPSYIEGQQNG